MTDATARAGSAESRMPVTVPPRFPRPGASILLNGPLAGRHRPRVTATGPGSGAAGIEGCPVGAEVVA
ncbi:hypothetical protein [Streptomyces sp. MAR4 CNX-425]|uniref:hypothetical protein n=1 Tax=Streptomyces sp. MAR4 CNX-425 TaxID=3406343 RepID=UPI003B510CE6